MPPEPRTVPTAERAGEWLGLTAAAVLLVAAGRLGLEMATLRGNVSAVWPASGVGIWLLARFGWRRWPVVAGAVAVLESAFTSFPPVAVAMATVGSTLEALAGAWLLRTVRARVPAAAWSDAAGLAAAALAAPVLSATLGAGTISLTAAEMVPFDHLWLTWWTGDAVGTMMVLPVLEALPRSAKELRRPTAAESGRAALTLGALATICWLAFAAEDRGSYLFAVFPGMLLALLLHGTAGVRLAAVAVATAGLVAEFAGLGPFRGASLHENLLNIQIFMGAVAMVALALPAFHRPGRSLLPVAVLLTGWSMSGWLFGAMHREVLRRQEEVFAERVATAQEAIRVRVESYVDVLLGGAAFFSASETVTRREWQTFVAALQMETRYPSLNSLGAVFPVAPENVTAWWQARQRDGGEEMRLRPFPSTAWTPGSPHYIIAYAEPQPRNAPSLGRDIATEPGRREAAERARDTGRPAINRRVLGTRDAERRSGLLIYVPFYRKGETPGTAAERRAAHEGWVYAQFFADSFLGEVLEPTAHHALEVFWFEAGEPTAERLLAASTLPVGAAEAASRLVGALPAFEQTTTLELGGQRFRLGWRRSPAYPAADASPVTWTAVSFTLATVLLAGLVLTLQTSGERAQALVDKRTGELAAARSRLQGVLDGTALSVIATNADGTIEIFNVGAERMLGFAAGETIGRRTLAEMHDPAELENCRAELARAGRAPADAAGVPAALAERDGTDEREWTYVGRDGRRIPVWLSLTRLRDHAGETLGYLGIAQDISVRKQLDAAKTEAFSRLAKLGSHLPGMIYQFRLGPDGTYSFPYASEGIRQIYRTTPEDVRHDAGPVFAAIHPEDLEAVAESIAVSARGLTRWHCVYRVRFPDGTERWLEGASSPEREADGGVLWHGFITDITERRRVEDALAEQRERLRLVLDEMPIGVRWFRVVNGKMESLLNPAHERITGVSRAESETPGVYLARTHPDDLPAQEEGISRLRRGEIATFAMEKRYVQPGGGVKWVAVTWTRRHLPGAGNFEELSTVLDITARKQLAANLEVARDQALEASRLKSEFLATISHEIRTPMNAVCGMAELLADSPLAEEQREMVQSIRDGAESLMAIINDILDFSRIEAGRMRLDRTEFDLRRTAEETVGLLAARAHGKGLRLTCECDPAPATRLAGDRGRIRQVLTNLAGNAIKFTERGEVRVLVRTTPQGPDAVRVRVAVTDTGVGVPEEAKHRLFQPFTQADGSVTRRFGGTGLGLAISRQLVELMGGQIGFESEEGKGSVFWFEVTLGIGGPLAEVAPEDERSAQGGRAPVDGISGGNADPGPADDGLGAVRTDLGAGRRLLLVEDNAANQRVAHLLLARMGFAVEVAADGAQALAALALRTYDGVIMDCQMPVLDGYETTRRVRAGAARNPRVPVIALTAHARAEDRSRCLESGMDDYVTKPIRVAELVAALERTGVAATARVAEAGPETAAAAAEAPADDVLDAEAVATVRELPGESGGALLPELVAAYVAEEAERLGELDRLCAARQTEAFADGVHGFGGNAASFGAVGVRRAALRAESAARRGDWHEADAQLRALRRECGRLRAELRRLGLAT